MTHGVYFMLSYTLAHAVDDGQDALVAGRPAIVQNSYAANSEKGPSVTDQRHRVAFSYVLAFTGTTSGWGGCSTTGKPPE